MRVTRLHARYHSVLMLSTEQHELCDIQNLIYIKVINAKRTAKVYQR